MGSPRGSVGVSASPVVLTRAAQDNAALRQALEADGFAVVEVPTAQIRTIPAEPDAESVAAWAAWAHAIAFASRNAVAGFVEQFGVAPLQRPGVVVGAVGESTAAALQAHGIAAGVVARDPSTGAELAKQLAGVLLPHKMVLIAQARFARRDLADGLAHAGHDVRVATVYENAVPDPPVLDEKMAPIFYSPETLIFAAAPSAVARLTQWLPHSRGCRWVAIGPTTADALRQAGIEPAAASPGPDFPSVLETLRSCRSN